MDAKVVQEINAITKLEEIKRNIRQAKQNYQQAQDTATKQQALTAWQKGIDQLQQLPPRTLTKEQAYSSYQAYLRDFRQASGLIVF